jgi:hypothetical protein
LNIAAAAAVATVVAAGCGGSAVPPAASAAAAPPAGTERLLAMLPQGAQIVAEIDLARLRANPVIGAVVTRALADGGDDDAAAAGAGPGGAAAGDAGPAPAAVWLRGVLRGGAGPGAASAGDRGAGAPGGAGAARPAGDASLALADQLVLAAYGVGTAQAATLTVMAAHGEIAGATRLLDGIYALGPPEWIEQVQQRIALASTGDAGFAIQPAPELLALRAHAMPVEAPGASLRITARLSFDARIALARQTGIEAAPAQLSAWGDVADDLAIVIDCDAADPGAPAADAGAAPAPSGESSARPTGGPTGGPRPAARRGDPARKLSSGLRAMLEVVAAQPTVRALGLPASLSGARLISQGSWVRAIIAIGPDRLRRVAERAAGMLGAPGGPSAPPTPRGDPSP